jgi:hypothetical protein
MQIGGINHADIVVPISFKGRITRGMGKAETKSDVFNIVVVGQNGRLQFEAVLFALSFRHSNPDSACRVIVAEPQPGPLWKNDPRMSNLDVLELLAALNVEVIPFDNRHFGETYPNGNKIEALLSLPKGEPFVFFDTDTLILDDIHEVPFDFNRPTASLNREGTWPEIELYGPGYTDIWKSLYDKFGLDFQSSLDMEQPDEYWQKYLYFNAGFFFYSCPHVFAERYLEYALAIRDDPPAELTCQTLFPWLDQIALPLVIHSLGGARETLPAGLLDGSVSRHWRVLPLLYARAEDPVIEMLDEITAPNKIKKVLKQYEPFKKMIYQQRGLRARALFDQNDMPRREQRIRNMLKSNKLWMR